MEVFDLVRQTALVTAAAGPARAPAMPRATPCIGLVLALAGCAPADRDYFPLDRAARWHYDVSLRTMDGVSRQKFVVDAVPASRSATGLAFHETPSGRRTYFAAGDDGLYVSAADAEGDLPLVLPAAPAPGRTWTRPTRTQVLQNTGPPWETLFAIRETVQMTYTIESLTDTATVPAGRFADCLKVTGRGTTSADVGNYIGRTRIEVRSEDWYAPGVGLVRSIREERTTADAIDYGRREMVLEDYQR